MLLLAYNSVSKPQIWDSYIEPNHIPKNLLLTGHSPLNFHLLLLLMDARRC